MMIISLIFMMKYMLNYILNSLTVFVKQYPNVLEHPSPITEWTHNMNTAVYLKQSGIEGVHQPSMKE